MKSILLRVVMMVAFIVSFSVPSFAQDIYTLDNTHTYVLWHISHFGYSNPSGKWMASGTLVLDVAKPQNSKVNVTINVADVVTGIPKLDEHLKTDTFFNVAKYPIATFVSDSVEMTGKNTANVHGILTVHGVSNPVTLKVTLNKIGVNSIDNKQTAGFSATAEIKRSDFGMNAYLPGLGNEVKLDIEAEAYK